MRESMVFYKSFADALDILPPEEYKKTVKAILEYAMDDIKPDLDGVGKSLFTMARPLIDANNKKYSNGKTGGRPPKAKQKTTGFENEKPMVIENENHTFSKSKPNVNVNDNENVNVNVNENVNGGMGGKRTRFTPPTPEDIMEYCREKNITVDADRFIDYYSAQGWKLSNGNPMKDWKAAVRNWSRDKRPVARSGTTNRFNDFEQRTYDFNAMERALTMKGGA